MKTNTETKPILATPMTRGAYNEYRGWTLPNDEDGNDEGYLVEYPLGGESNHPNHTNYVSWSPKVLFENMYGEEDIQMNYPIEQVVQVKSLTAPRVTTADIDRNIIGEYYFTAAEGVIGNHESDIMTAHFDELDLLTICVLVLKNGFTVLGKSACASPENFNTQVGRRIARVDAIDNIWPLMGYELKTQLAKEPT